MARRVIHGRVDGGVEHVRAHGDDAGKARCAAEDIAEEFAQLGVRLQDAEELGRCRHPVERSIEGGERGIGIAASRKTFEQCRHEFGEHLAGARALHRRAAAEVPAAHDLCRRGRIVEAHAGQGFQRVGIVRDTGEDEAADVAVERRRMFEEPRIMLLDLAQVEGQLLFEAFEPRMAAEFREARDGVMLGRQAMGLLVCHHLQAMLDTAQVEIGSGEIVHRILRHPAIGLQLAQHVERARAAQLRTPATEDQLLRLHEELDFADAAAAKLHVMTRHRDLRMAAHRMDLALHGVDVGDGRIVEILAPDEGREILEKLRAERLVAGHGPRLDERRALPVLAEHLVIGEGSRQRDRHCRRSRIRAQAQVDAQHVTVARALLQHARQRTRHGDEGARRLAALGDRR